ncbi:MAG TPA: pyruvate kinase [Candidatus Binataceae bacterium]|nr:pyruvate kinase [Candidatus Binataceae bacterium]
MLPSNNSASPEPHHPRHSSVEALISRIGAIRASLVEGEDGCKRQLAEIDPQWRKSAGNLMHYLALRHHDIRHLQEELAVLGLSSLGRSESHVMSTLDAVLSALHHLAGQHVEFPINAAYSGFQEGSALLAAHTDALLGHAPINRSVRIMVTMPPEAANDYSLVRDLLAHGMDCMRVNCAHDTPEIWAKIIEHLERARRELNLPCRILMDIAGPKLRTGPMEPGPQVVVWHPRRDSLGRVVSPARVWLAPLQCDHRALAAADACVPVPGQWLSEVQPGERIHFRDAREERRILEVLGSSEGGKWAQCTQTAYVTPGTLLSRIDANMRDERDARVGELPALSQSILLKRGDEIELTREAIPGKSAQLDASGRIINRAKISCTLAEVFPQTRVGERIWFDDGKIGGVIREVRPDALAIEITHAKPNGSRLGADKGINLPDTRIRLPAITTKDMEDLRFIVAHADLVGMSFVCHERDVFDLQSRLHELNGDHLGIVLKIETRRAFERLPNLILAAMRRHPAGVMIARGDLAVECGYERTAEVQEEILWICEAAHMPVIWATQVLESLAKKGMPSRAEITDAAMGERAECVMLNKGPHVVEAVTALDDILCRMQDHQSKKSSRLRRLRVGLLQEAD